MTIKELIAAFIYKWGPGGPSATLNEEQGAQQNFIELCAVLGVATPSGDDYVFEKRNRAPGQRTGFADVFKRDCFAWENKAPGEPLDIALNQMMRYAMSLGNPPLFVVSDRFRIEVYTHFTGTPTERYVVKIDELGDPAKRELLRRCFEDPESFRPARTIRQITEEAAEAFAATASRLRAASVPDHVTSHLLTQCVFCFFAESIHLLPNRPLWRLLNSPGADPDALRQGLHALFTSMRDGTMFGADKIKRFNGGLFQQIEVPLLSVVDLDALRTASDLHWGAIDPTIFGTLFERGLNPTKTNLIGAHFTDPATISRLIESVIKRPLLAEWEGVRDTLVRLFEKRDKLEAAALKITSGTPTRLKQFAGTRSAASAADRQAKGAFRGYLERLREYRVLDPACGSGNFLYLALKALKDIELKANGDVELLGLQREVDSFTGPANVLGIEINEYAAELARVTVWIGELQWRHQNGFPNREDPVLDPLNQIDCRDALMNVDGSEAIWPTASVVVGNPPFVGDKKMRAQLGDAYTDRLRRLFNGRVPGGADLVCYWFEKARAQIEHHGLEAAGLVATNSISQGANREVLERVQNSTRIFDVWADQPWINDGAAVRVSLIAFGEGDQTPRLDGLPVAAIYTDLRAQAVGASALDLTTARPLSENRNSSFFGFCLAGPFKVNPDVARRWLREPANPNGRPNSDVLKPLWNGTDVRGRLRDRWTVDFGATMRESDAALYELPFEYVRRVVKPTRLGNREASRSERWWLHGRPRPELRRRLVNVSRMIVTSETSKHRVFVWFPVSAAPEHKLVVIPRADDVTFGLLSCRFHVVWALRRGSALENRPVYTTSACFHPYPFPAGLTPADTAHQRTDTLTDGTLIPSGLVAPLDQAEAIGRAAKRLSDLREAWLNPPEWTRRAAEIASLSAGHPTYPDRVVPREEFQSQLAQRTMTKLYNQRPTWLSQAHEQVDVAVARAYGWNDYTPQMTDADILMRLFELNRERSAGE